jgi:DDE superfamily endonuclease
MCCAPHAGWRQIAVTAHRTMPDCAHHMQWLVEERYPEADRMRVVLDHLNTHKPAALYETFAPADARRLLKTLAVHYTPQHGSWLTMAEMALRL